MPDVALPGLRTHFRVDGPQGAPVVMLSNSLGTALAMWDDQVAALVPRFRVLRYDTRGHGATSVPPGPYTIAAMGRDVLALLDRLSIERVAFCGLSMGGMIGMWLAQHAAARIERLALCSTAARIGEPAAYDARIAKVQEAGMAPIAEAVLARWFTPAFLARDGPPVAAARGMLLATPPEGYAAACAAVRDMDERGGLSRIGCPTLVVAATHDQATPPGDGRYLAQHIAGARYVELDAAHICNMERPADFNAALLAFLTE